MKHLVVAALFIASLWSAAGARAGSPDLRPAGRPDTAAADSKAPQPNQTSTLGSPIAIDEGFEQVNVFGAGMFANGWTRQNNSDLANSYWWGGIPTSAAGAFNAFDGADAAYIMDTYLATQLDGGTISDWLVAPPTAFGAGSTVSFYTRTKVGSTYPDRLQVRACTSGPCTNVGTGSEDVGDFTTLLLDIDPGETQGIYPEAWTQFTLGTADGVPASGTGRIAFRYYVHDSGSNGTRGNLIGLDRVVVATSASPASTLDLAVTLSPADAVHPNACGTATSIDVTVGDQVNVCYTTTNNSIDTLIAHSLRDDVNGTLLTQQPYTVVPGASYQYNRIVTVGESQTISSTWTAFPQLSSIPWYLQPQPNTFAYSWDNSRPAPFIDVTDGTPIGTPEQNPSTIPFPSDFNFLFYDRPITQFCALYQGVFESVTKYCASNFSYGNRTIPDDNFIGASSMFVYWAGLTSGQGNIYYKVIGAAPNRQFVIEWANVPNFSGATMPLNAEIVLNETVNTIEFRYGNVVFGIPGLPNYDYGGGATIGLQNQFMEDRYSYQTQSLEGVTRLIWTPLNSAVYTNTRQVQINASVPTIVVNPVAVNATTPSHGTATQALTIGNAGAGRLDWSIETVAAAGNMPVVPHFVLPLGDPNQASFGRAPATTRGAATNQTQAPLVVPSTDTTKFAYASDLAEGPYLWNFNPDDLGNASITAYESGDSVMTGATFLDDDFSKLYAVDAANSQLVWYDVTAPYTTTHVVGTIGIPANLITGMKQDPTSGVVYLSTADGQSSGLWTIDPATAAVRQIGTITDAPGIIDIAFDAQGNLYAVDILMDALIAIDKTSGLALPIGSLGFDANYASGLAFDYATGLLYFTSIDMSSGTLTPGLWTIDTTTGHAAQVGPIVGVGGSFAQWDALAIAHPANNPCSDPATIPWLRLGTLGGVIPAGGDPATALAHFDASALADGTYSAKLCIHSNDPLSPHQVLPVTFNVGSVTDRIFADGFDGTTP